jgi:hypothetical protein
MTHPLTPRPTLPTPFPENNQHQHLLRTQRHSTLVRSKEQETLLRTMKGGFAKTTTTKGQGGEQGERCWAAQLTRHVQHCDDIVLHDGLHIHSVLHTTQVQAVNHLSCVNAQQGQG